MGQTVRIITIHGTNDGDPGVGLRKWWEVGSDYLNETVAALEADGHAVEVEAFRWSGENLVSARLKGSEALAARLKPGTKTILIAHSHGGTVAQEALKFAKLDNPEAAFDVTLLTAGTPFLKYKFTALGPLMTHAAQTLLISIAVLIPFGLALSAYMEYGPFTEATWEWVTVNGSPEFLPTNAPVWWFVMSHSNTIGLIVFTALLIFLFSTVFRKSRGDFKHRARVQADIHPQGEPLVYHTIHHPLDEAISLLRHAFAMKTTLTLGQEIRKTIPNMLRPVFVLSLIVFAVLFVFWWITPEGYQSSKIGEPYQETTPIAEFLIEGLGMPSRDNVGSLWTLDQGWGAAHIPIALLITLAMVVSAIGMTFLGLLVVIYALLWPLSFLINTPINGLLSNALRTTAFGTEQYYQVTYISSDPSYGEAIPISVSDAWLKQTEQETLARGAGLFHKFRDAAARTNDLQQAVDLVFSPDVFLALIHCAYFEPGEARDAIVARTREIAGSKD